MWRAHSLLPRDSSPIITGLRPILRADWFCSRPDVLAISDFTPREPFSLPQPSLARVRSARTDVLLNERWLEVAFRLVSSSPAKSPSLAKWCTPRRSVNALHLEPTSRGDRTGTPGRLGPADALVPRGRYTPSAKVFQVQVLRDESPVQQGHCDAVVELIAAVCFLDDLRSRELG